MSAGSRNFLIIVFSLGILVLGLLPIVRSWPSGSDRATVASTPDRFDAQVICEKFVRNELRAPSTAKFSGSSENTAVNSGNTWTVRGWVDSQNGFGAQIRSNYECRAAFTGRLGDSLNWNRESLTINGR